MNIKFLFEFLDDMRTKMDRNENTSYFDDSYSKGYFTAINEVECYLKECIKLTNDSNSNQIPSE